jgi:prevent-host-death family protein
MKAVKISDFKAHLAKYLRLVKSGEVIEILDRGVLVAKVISPAETATKLEIRKPLKNPQELSRLVSKLSNSFSGEVMDLLAEERMKR